MSKEALGLDQWPFDVNDKTSNRRKCINCKHLKSHQKMTRHGFGTCQKMDNWHFTNIVLNRHCKMFQRTDKEKILGRWAYVDMQDERRTKHKSIKLIKSV